MKKFLLLLMFLAIPAYAVDTAVIGSMWKQDGSIVFPADDITAADFTSSALLFDTPGAYMHEDNNGGDGTFQTLTTTFTQWSGVTSSSATTGITVDEGDGTITFATGLGGRYVGVLHASFKAPSGRTITIAIFKNNSSIDDIKRSMAKGPELLPVYRNITSDDGSAVFDTQSSITYLYASDGDDLIGIEAGTGSTRCMDIRVGFSGVIEPAYLMVGTSAYQSNNSNHWENVLFKNYSTGVHVDVNELTKDFEDVGAAVEPYERVSWAFAPIGPSSQYVDGGAFEVLFQHNDVSCSNTHKMHLDEVKLVESYSSAVVAFPIEFDVEAGDVLTIRYKADEDNIKLNISDLGLNIFKIGL